MQMPTITQYADAIAEPAGLARTLGEFRVQRDNYGEVRIRTGNNASVFRVESRGRDMMLKCYVRSRTDLPFIYDYIAASGDELFPPMELMPGELYVFDPFGKGMYFDILAGDWIEGHTLDTEIKRACRDKDGKRMEFLSRAFDALALELLARPWAHG
ncbi:MAG: hypothetical protein LIO77_00425, partial [Rikenellaceae bacterium]|nr:hypothetical protein [Rikenellaceae bacterium]